MKKIIILALLAAWALSAVVSPVFAEETQGMAVVDVGNKLCPVEGGPVSGQHFVTYEGKRYGLCCPACDKTFLADPEKYIAKMKEQEAGLAAKEAPAETGSENGMY